MNKPQITTIDPSAIESLVERFMTTNRARYGGLRMEAGSGGPSDASDSGKGGAGDDSKDDDSKDGDAKGGDPKDGRETVEYWKRRSRENERRAKENAEKAKQLDQLEEQQKTEEQRRADEAAKRQQEADDLRSENLRLRAASENNIFGEDEDGVAYTDLIGGRDKDTIEQNAKSIGRLLAAKKERDTLQEKYEGKGNGAGSGRPQPNLRPGSVPAGDELRRNGTNGISEAERRFGKPKND